MYGNLLLGVDSGATKTDFYLFDVLGNCVAKLRTGTSSHEHLPGGYEEVEQVLTERINELCRIAGCTCDDIGSAVLGLAGADIREQHQRLSAIANHILPNRTMVCNDSLLGILAAAPNGAGVCCINGTGTVVGGINQEGRMHQVGGIGGVSSDFGGGLFLASEVLRHVYSARYRDAEPTMLTQGVCDMLNIGEDADLMESFHPTHLKINKELEQKLNLLAFYCAKEGDETAQSILLTMARNLGQSTAGCIKELQFNDTVTIVLAGSLWVKGGYQHMIDCYREEVEKRVSCPCEFIILRESPATGAVLEAYRRLTRHVPSKELKEKITFACI